MKTLTLIALLIGISTIAFAQDSVTVYLARHDYKGKGVVFILDGKVICEPENNTYVKITTTPGLHTVSADYWKKSEKEDTKRAQRGEIKLDFKKEETYYFKLNYHMKYYYVTLFFDPIPDYVFNGIVTELTPEKCQ